MNTMSTEKLWEMAADYDPANEIEDAGMQEDMILAHAYDNVEVKDLIDDEVISVEDIYCLLYDLEKVKPLPIIADELITKMLLALTLEELVQLKFVDEETVISYFENQLRIEEELRRL
jgi:hypothetical protein